MRFTIKENEHVTNACGGSLLISIERFALVCSMCVFLSQIQQNNIKQLVFASFLFAKRKGPVYIFVIGYFYFYITLVKKETNKRASIVITSFFSYFTLLIANWISDKRTSNRYFVWVGVKMVLKGTKQGWWPFMTRIEIKVFWCDKSAFGQVVRDRLTTF